MKKFDVIIIGGGPAGVTAAISAKNTYPDKKVALVRREKTPLIPCGIPYVIHTLKSVDENILPDAPLKKNNVALVIDEVVDCKEKTLVLKSGSNLEFDKLILAAGSNPFVPPIPGKDKKGVWLVMKDYDYLSELKSAIEKANNITIIGGGFIGVEFADELLKAGKSVSIIEMLPSLLPLSMDEEFGKFIEDNLKSRGANIYTNIALKEILGGDKTTGVLLADGKKLDADLIILSIGYRPNVDLAKKIGLEVNARFGVVVDNFGRTSVKDIFAIGDCAAKHNCYTNEYSAVMLASTAGTEGRLTGANLFEINAMKSFPGVLGTFSTKIGNVAVASTGLSERDCKSANISYIMGTAEAPDHHPGKLPGSSMLFVKLIFSKFNHTLIGAQLRGGGSVGEIINILATIIQNKMTDIEIDTMQIGTHPLLTASPIAYQIVNATANALKKVYAIPKPSSVLVVDDEEVVCDSCYRILTREGFKVDSSTNPEDGLKMAKEKDYTVILLDMKMSEMNGLEFLEKLRKEKPDVPVLVITGYPSKENADASFNLGVFDYIHKPFTPDKITESVKKALIPA